MATNLPSWWDKVDARRKWEWNLNGAGNTYTPEAIRQYAQASGIDPNNNQKIFEEALSKGISPGQIDEAFGRTPGTTAAWAKANLPKYTEQNAYDWLQSNKDKNASHLDAAAQWFGVDASKTGDFFNNFFTEYGQGGNMRHGWSRGDFADPLKTVKTPEQVKAERDARQADAATARNAAFAAQGKTTNKPGLPSTPMPVGPQAPSPAPGSNLGFGGVTSGAPGTGVGTGTVVQQPLAGKLDNPNDTAPQGYTRAQYGDMQYVAPGTMAGYTAPGAFQGPDSRYAPGAFTGAQNATLKDYTKNPYLDQMAQGITTQVNDNLQRNILPGIKTNANMTGTYGSSRQGIAEGLAIGESQKGLTNALSNLYGSDYQSTQARNMQQYGMDQGFNMNNANAQNQYNLGLGNYGMGMSNAANQYNLNAANAQNSYNQAQANFNQNAANSQNQFNLNNRGQQIANDQWNAQFDNNIFQQNFNNQMTGANFGLGVLDRQMGYNNTALGIGNQVQNQPWQNLNNAGNVYNAVGGMGGISSQNMQGNPWLGALGGAQLGANLWNSWNGTGKP